MIEAKYIESFMTDTYLKMYRFSLIKENEPYYWRKWFRKTVLMKCLVGLLEVDKGQILYDKRNFSEMQLFERAVFARNWYAV